MAHAYRILKRDDQVTNASPEVSDQVMKLQQLLKNLGFLPDSTAIDGVFGPITEQAAKDFQCKESLEVDGVVGVMTWAKLLKISPIEIVITHYPPAKESSPAPSSSGTLMPNSPLSLRVTNLRQSPDYYPQVRLSLDASKT